MKAEAALTLQGFEISPRSGTMSRDVLPVMTGTSQATALQDRLPVMSDPSRAMTHSA